jgi:hypothetical protein
MVTWFNKQVLTICCLQEKHLTDKNKHWIRMKRWKKVFQANGPQKQEGVVTSEKVDFKSEEKEIRRERRSFCINKEERTILTYMHQLLGCPTLLNKHYQT